MNGSAADVLQLEGDSVKLCHCIPVDSSIPYIHAWVSTASKHPAGMARRFYSPDTMRLCIGLFFPNVTKSSFRQQPPMSLQVRVTSIDSIIEYRRENVKVRLTSHFVIGEEEKKKEEEEEEGKKKRSTWNLA